MNAEALYQALLITNLQALPITMYADVQYLFAAALCPWIWRGYLSITVLHMRTAVRGICLDFVLMCPCGLWCAISAAAHRGVIEIGLP